METRPRAYSGPRIYLKASTIAQMHTTQQTRVSTIAGAVAQRLMSKTAPYRLEEFKRPRREPQPVGAGPRRSAKAVMRDRQNVWSISNPTSTKGIKQELATTSSLSNCGEMEGERRGGYEAEGSFLKTLAKNKQPKKA